MKKTLFINACVRPESRTRMLAQHALDRMGGEITEVDLGKENIEPLNGERLEERNACQKKKDFSHEMFRYAKAFAEADEILIAAPFWDLAFPAILRNYIENICVQGLTFYYTEEGFPASLCRAKKLVYVMTAGGPTEGMDFGFPYVDTLCRVFFGIEETACFKAIFSTIRSSSSVSVRTLSKENPSSPVSRLIDSVAAVAVSARAISSTVSPVSRDSSWRLGSRPRLPVRRLRKICTVL